MGTIKDYWYTWLWRDAVTKTITICFIMWVIVSVGLLITSAPAQWVGLFALPASLARLPMRAWTVATYMVTHVDFLHMLVNMMWLLVFGRLFMQTQGGMRMGILYVYGGLVGAATFIATAALYPHTPAMMYGASCSVMAIVGAATMIMPRWHINLFLFGPVKVIWVAVMAVIFFVVLSNGLDQFLAHGMGLVTGIAYAYAKKHGVDLCQPVVTMIDALKGRHIPTATVQRPIQDTRHGSMSPSEALEFDALLAKVSRSGYSSLSATERQRLFNLSQKIKK